MDNKNWNPSYSPGIDTSANCPHGVPKSYACAECDPTLQEMSGKPKAKPGFKRAEPRPTTYKQCVHDQPIYLPIFAALVSRQVSTTLLHQYTLEAVKEYRQHWPCEDCTDTLVDVSYTVDAGESRAGVTCHYYTISPESEWQAGMRLRVFVVKGETVTEWDAPTSNGPKTPIRHEWMAPAPLRMLARHHAEDSGVWRWFKSHGIEWSRYT
jgi:hypothetical protein